MKHFETELRGINMNIFFAVELKGVKPKIPQSGIIPIAIGTTKAFSACFAFLKAKSH